MTSIRSGQLPPSVNTSDKLHYSQESELSIVVPTHNRAELIDYFLQVHAPIVEDLRIPLVIVDNASTDSTPEICHKWGRQFDCIYYTRFDTYVEGDESFARALQVPASSYVWLMGDGYEVGSETLRKALDLVRASEGAWDALIVNLVQLVPSADLKVYSCRETALKELAWLMTCMSCNIFSRKLLDSANYEKYYGTNFIHVGIVFDAISSRDFRLAFAPNISVASLKCPTFRKQGWGNAFFDISFERWPNFVMGLSSCNYNLTSRILAIRSFYDNTRLFRWRNILHLRAQGVLRREQIRRYYPAIQAFAHARLQRLMSFMLLIPPPLAILLRDGVEALRRRSYLLQIKLGLWREGR